VLKSGKGTFRWFGVIAAAEICGQLASLHRRKSSHGQRQTDDWNTHLRGLEELDFVGPMEVFGAASLMGASCALQLVAQSVDPVRGRWGMWVIPDLPMAKSAPLGSLCYSRRPGCSHTRPQESRDPSICKVVPSLRNECLHWIVDPCRCRSAGELSGHHVPRSPRQAAGLSASHCRR
jgi:hypothetical protein